MERQPIGRATKRLPVWSSSWKSAFLRPSFLALATTRWMSSALLTCWLLTEVIFWPAFTPWSAASSFY